MIDKISLNKQKANLDADFLKLKYVEEGLTSTEIARMTFSSRQVVHRLLNKYNIPKNHVSNRLKGYYVYGYKKCKFASRKKLEEQNGIKLIISLRDKGFRYNKIANFVNESEIPTKKKIGLWSAKVVRGIYIRNSK